MTAPAALAGIKVLDVAGTIASGYCGKLFADHGAQVVNVEPPGGGFETRREPPFLSAASAPEDSALHAYLNANKASVDPRHRRRACSPASARDGCCRGAGRWPL